MEARDPCEACDLGQSWVSPFASRRRRHGTPPTTANQPSRPSSARRRETHPVTLLAATSRQSHRGGCSVRFRDSGGGAQHQAIRGADEARGSPGEPRNTAGWAGMPRRCSRPRRAQPPAAASSKGRTPLQKRFGQLLLIVPGQPARRCRRHLLLVPLDFGQVAIFNARSHMLLSNGIPATCKNRVSFMHACRKLSEHPSYGPNECGSFELFPCHITCLIPRAAGIGS